MELRLAIMKAMETFPLKMCRDLRSRDFIVWVEHQPRVVTWVFPKLTGRGKTVPDALHALADAITSDTSPEFAPLRGDVS